MLVCISWVGMLQAWNALEMWCLWRTITTIACNPSQHLALDRHAASRRTPRSWIIPWALPRWATPSSSRWMRALCRSPQMDPSTYGASGEIAATWSRRRIASLLRVATSSRLMRAAEDQIASRQLSGMQREGSPSTARWLILRVDACASAEHNHCYAVTRGALHRCSRPRRVAGITTVLHTRASTGTTVEVL